MHTVATVFSYTRFLSEDNPTKGVGSTTESGFSLTSTCCMCVISDNDWGPGTRQWHFTLFLPQTCSEGVSNHSLVASVRDAERAHDQRYRPSGRIAASSYPCESSRRE